MSLGQGCAVRADAPANIYLVFSASQAGAFLLMEMGEPSGKPRTNVVKLSIS